MANNPIPYVRVDQQIPAPVPMVEGDMPMNAKFGFTAKDYSDHAKGNLGFTTMAPPRNTTAFSNVKKGR